MLAPDDARAGARPRTGGRSGWRTRFPDPPR